MRNYPLMLLYRSNKNCTIKNYNSIMNRVLILRSYGGVGDILAMRMIFEDLKVKYPEFHISWAVPHNLFAAAKHHPYIDEVVSAHNYDDKSYVHIYNLSTICTRYEWKMKKFNDKNRSDIWAEHFGLNLSKHNMHMPDYSSEFENIKQKLINLGWDQKKKLLCFAPRSAIQIKNLTNKQCEFIKQITSDFFLYIVNLVPIIELDYLKIPTLCGTTLKEAFAAVQMSNCVIATDTGLLHAAAGYKKPTLGIFSYVSGEVYCKYYDTVQVVQKHYKSDPSWCGPCHDFANCSVTDNCISKPCLTEITEEMIYKNWLELLNKYAIN